MRAYIFILSALFSVPLVNSSHAQWISQAHDDPFGDNHIVGAATAKFGKGLIVRCVGGKKLEIMFLPNEKGSDEVIAMANLAGTTIKIRIDNDAIDELQAVVQLSEGKVIAIADVALDIVKRMMKSKRRIATVLTLLDNQFGTTSFGVRGSGRNIKKVIKACSEVNKIGTSLEANSFIAINRLKKTFFTNPVDGKVLISVVRSKIREKTYHSKIAKMIIESIKSPYKVSVDFILKERISKQGLVEISEIVRNGAGRGFERYFIGFYLKGDSGGTYWATAHHNPKLEVKFLGLSDEAYQGFMSRVKKYHSEEGEKIIADAIITHGFSFHVVIFKKAQNYLARIEYQDGSNSEEQLLKKDGRYWKVDDPYKENYRLFKGMLEIHDREGIVSKGKIIQRK